MLPAGDKSPAGSIVGEEEEEEQEEQEQEGKKEKKEKEEKKGEKKAKEKKHSPVNCQRLHRDGVEV